MTSVKCTVEIQMTTQEVDGRTLPGFVVTRANFDINDDHIKIKLGGNLVAKIADDF